MVPSANEIKQREQWEKMKKRGHLSYVAQDILIFVGSYIIVRALHILCFKLGWLNSPGSTSFEDMFFCGALTGGIVGELHWSDMKRKFDNLKPSEDRTMI